jgi:hypothetical protein
MRILRSILITVLMTPLSMAMGPVDTDSDAIAESDSDTDRDPPPLSTLGQILGFQHQLESLGSVVPLRGIELHKLLVDHLEKNFPEELMRVRHMLGPYEAKTVKIAIEIILFTKYKTRWAQPCYDYRNVNFLDLINRPAEATLNKYGSFIDFMYLLPLLEPLYKVAIKSINLSSFEFEYLPVTILQLQSLKTIYVAKGKKLSKSKLVPDFYEDMPSALEDVQIIEVEK